MQLKRVVVTGLGAVTPLGNSVNDYWKNLVNGVSGAAPITRFDASKFQTETFAFAKGDGTPRFNPFFIPKMIADICSGHISMRFGLRGPNFTTVSACASSTNALIDAFNYIRLGKANAIVAGGSEAAINESGIGGFNACMAMSTRNDDPSKASRPYDK